MHQRQRVKKSKQPTARRLRRPGEPLYPEANLTPPETLPEAYLHLHRRASTAEEATALEENNLPHRQRAELAAYLGRIQGNQRLARAAGALQREVETNPVDPAAVQLKDGKKGTGANPGGGGPGKIQNAAEQPYDVAGKSLADLGDQLKRLGGFASETFAAIGIKNRVTPVKTPDGKYQATVKWVIKDANVQLPRWANYNTACPAAQQEWDRFLSQARLHEQQAHVDASRNFVDQLAEADTVITGDTVADLQSNLEAKLQELGGRLQAIHDACDHGASVDAFLHPDNGVCE